MSDTPKSDALKDQYAMHGIGWYELCRELERKNAKLRDELNMVRGHNAAMWKALHDIMTESDEPAIWRMARTALRKEAQP